MSTPLASGFFKGIIPPLVTPLLDRDTLDGAGLERMIEHVIAGGIHGIFLLGTTGEGPNLSYHLRRRLIQRASEIVNGRIPVLVGITDSAFPASLAVARWAAEAGAQAVVAAPPYYFGASQEELRIYFTHLLRELPLPLMLYNMPAMTKLTLERDTVLRLLDNPAVLGIKDSSGSSGQLKGFLGMKSYRPDWSVFVGAEESLLNSLESGADGGVNGGANVFPKLYVSLYEAHRRGDVQAAKRLQAVVQEVGQRLYHLCDGGGAVIKGIKGALALRGLCTEAMTEPFQPFESDQRAKLNSALEHLQNLLGGI